MARTKFTPNAGYNDPKLLGLRRALGQLVYWLRKNVSVEKRSWPGGRAECAAAGEVYRGLMECTDLPNEIKRIANRPDILDAWEPWVKELKELCDHELWERAAGVVEALPTGRADKPTGSARSGRKRTRNECLNN